MSIAVQNTFTMIPLDSIIDKLNVRALNAFGLKKIQESMQWAGFLDNYPLIVTPLGDGTYQLLDGNHRYEAAKSLGIESVPCVVKETLEDSERYMLAFQSNGAAESVVASTLVTYAEFIWARLEEKDGDGKKKYTQSEIGKMLGWSREKVKDYAELQKICHQAWGVIGDTFERVSPNEENGVSPSNGDMSPFTVRLLGSILDLTPAQQAELCQKLATDKDFSKGKFKTLAESYKARNEMKAWALEQLGPLGKPYTTHLVDEIESGGYDADWGQKTHPKLHKLIASLRDEYEQKNSIHSIHGDFYEVVKTIADESIDLIVTDPPYNIANDREFNLDGRSNRSQDFGEWDCKVTAEFRALFFTWASEWKRILRPQGSGYAFVSYRYASYLRDALQEAGLHVHVMLTWYKTNPGPQIVKTTFRSSCEHILFFTKGKGGHTFNWQGENEMHDHISIPICQGRERLVDAKGETLHPTQKPVSLLRHLIQISSNRGDTVFDGFAGVGSSGAAAKELKRKFIGIEKDDMFFAAMQRRLADVG